MSGFSICKLSYLIARALVFLGLIPMFMAEKCLDDLNRAYIQEVHEMCLGRLPLRFRLYKLIKPLMSWDAWSKMVMWLG